MFNTFKSATLIKIMSDDTAMKVFLQALPVCPGAVIADKHWLC